MRIVEGSGRRSWVTRVLAEVGTRPSRELYGQIYGQICVNKRTFGRLGNAFTSDRMTGRTGGAFGFKVRPYNHTILAPARSMLLPICCPAPSVLFRMPPSRLEDPSSTAPSYSHVPATHPNHPTRRGEGGKGREGEGGRRAGGGGV